MAIMKRFLLSAFCAGAALSLLTPQSRAQTLGNSGGLTTGGLTTGGLSPASGLDPGSAGGTGTGGRHRGGGVEERAREIIKKYDRNGDHALDAAELASFFEAIHHRAEERREQAGGTSSLTSASSGHEAHTPLEHAQKAIEKFDKNGDGKLEARELAALLMAIREKEKEHGGQSGQGAGRVAPATTTPTVPPQS